MNYLEQAQLTLEDHKYQVESQTQDLVHWQPTAHGGITPTTLKSTCELLVKNAYTDEVKTALFPHHTQLDIVQRGRDVRITYPR